MVPHRRALLALVFLLVAACPLGAQGELVIVKDGVYHRPACPVIRDATDVLAMNVGQAEARGFKSHPDCDPNVAKPGEPSRNPGGKPAKSSPIYVFVEPNGKLYHKETCRKLGPSPTKVELTATVAKKYWPCGVCKPPILPRPAKKQ
ncbi:MAG TPA: hypothetical protein VF147_10880 [Vicinamibacterales bacterium]